MLKTSKQLKIEHAREVKELQEKMYKYPELSFHNSKEHILSLEKQIRKAEFDQKVASGEKEAMHEAKIAKARDYPITDLIDHKKFFAKCPFHNDNTASLYLKNNFYHCFSCQANGDVIDFVMKTMDLSFRQAVEKLS